MKVVTSVTLFKGSIGQRIGITYSEVNESGDVTKENVKVSKVVRSEEIQETIDTLMKAAAEIVEEA